MDHVKPRRPPGNAARARLPWRGLAMALLLLLGAMASAHAQIGGGHGRRQNNQQQTPQRSWHRRHRSCPRYGHGWKRARSSASRAAISSDIRRKSPMVRVLQHQDRRPIATLSGSRRASRFWLTTVPHAPKSSRRTSPKRPGGPIATCRRLRHPLSPKAQAQGNDGPALGFLGNKGAPLLGDWAPAVFRRQQTIAPIGAETPAWFRL